MTRSSKPSPLMSPSVAEHHVAVASLDPCIVGTVALNNSDDEVVEAVAVDVAGRGHRPAGEITLVLAVDDEAAVAGRDGGEVDRGLNSDRGLAEHHVAVARLLTGIVGATSTHGPDDEVVEAIPVDVAGR